MKIVHLSTSTSGGAAETANSLARIQSKFGHDSIVLSRDAEMSMYQNVKSTVSTFISLSNANDNYGQVTHFSSNGFDLSRLWNEKPEIVFIHNWFNLLTVENIAVITNRTPTILVAHDARLATGGCHVTLGCQNFMSGCSQCPAARIDLFSTIAKNSIDKVAAKLGKYAIVSPSKWLLDLLGESAIFQSATITKVIRNPTNVLAVPAGISTTQSTKVFTILFVAANFDASYKGFGLLLKSLSLINSKHAFDATLNVQVVGGGNSDGVPVLDPRVKISFLGQLDSFEVHKLMQRSDLLVVPSLSENYPGVVGEAQILGCTVAASRVGGIPEMIEHGVTGFLFEPNAQACISAIIEAVNSSNRIKINTLAKEHAIKRYNESEINHEYENVIEELMRS
jgi:glycosyltransferase involved in cell wall biosynthesis